MKRHRANISIDALSRVNGTAVDESVRILQPIFDRACERMWPHAHTADQLQARPTIGEAEGDWKTLKAVADAVGRYGLYAVVGLVILGALAYGGLRVWRKRIEAA